MTNSDRPRVYTPLGAELTVILATTGFSLNFKQSLILRQKFYEG